LIRPETPTANGVSPRDTPLAFQLQRFIFQALNQSQRGGASPAATQHLRQARNALRAHSRQQSGAACDGRILGAPRIEPIESRALAPSAARSCGIIIDHVGQLDVRPGIAVSLT